jgi:hypothetical protein
VSFLRSNARKVTLQYLNRPSEAKTGPYLQIIFSFRLLLLNVPLRVRLVQAGYGNWGTRDARPPAPDFS